MSSSSSPFPSKGPERTSPAGNAGPVSPLDGSGDRDEFIRRVVEVAPCILYVYDLVEQKCIWGSRMVTDVLGYSRGQIQAMAGGLMQTLLHPDDGRDYARHLTKVLHLHDHEGAEFECRIRRADGTWIWLHSRETVFRRAADGSVRQILGAASDITAKRASAASLIESEARFRAMADGLPLIVWVHDAGGRQEFVNATFCHFFGVKREDMRGGTWQILMHPHDAASYLGKFEEAVAKHASFNAEVRVRNAAGEWRWIESWGLPRFSADGTFLGIVGTSADVTVRREVEQRLRASEERYRATFESAPIGIAEVTLDGRFERFNPAVSHITGYAEHELRGKPWSDVVHPDDFAEDWVMVGRLLAGEIAVFSKDKQYFRKDGSIVWVCLTVSIIRGAGGAPLHLLTLLQDISARRAAETTLAEAKAKLREHAEELERMVAERTLSLQDTITELEHFSYTVSHDLRAPLRAISQFSMILLEDYAERLDGTARSYLERIQRAGVRMYALTTDLLRYTNVASRTTVSLQNVAIEKVLEEIFETNPNLPRAARIVVTAPLIPLRGCPTLLQQILTNLIENAVRYAARGGQPQIVIRTELRPAYAPAKTLPKHVQRLFQRGAPAVTSSLGSEPADAGEAGLVVRLWVEDDGVGIAPEFHDRIFGLFERLPASGGEGTGVGLALVAKAVERMGGRCGVESAVGKGSRFWVELKPGNLRSL